MPKKTRPMTSRQCEIAAESYCACLLAQSGYDVFVQYGARQEDFDLVATKGERTLRISVKGTQDGLWMLAVRYLRPGVKQPRVNVKQPRVDYIAAIKQWEHKQQKELVYMFVSFVVPQGQAPRVYVARPDEIAKQLRQQSLGQGRAVLREDTPTHHPRARHKDKIPDTWHYSTERIDAV